MQQSNFKDGWHFGVRARVHVVCSLRYRKTIKRIMIFACWQRRNWYASTFRPSCCSLKWIWTPLLAAGNQSQEAEDRAECKWHRGKRNSQFSLLIEGIVYQNHQIKSGFDFAWAQIAIDIICSSFFRTFRADLEGRRASLAHWKYFLLMIARACCQLILLAAPLCWGLKCRQKFNFIFFFYEILNIHGDDGDASTSSFNIMHISRRTSTHICLQCSTQNARSTVTSTQ